MASKLMSFFTFGKRTGGVKEFDETLSSPGNTDWIFIPRGVDSVPVALNPTAGEGRIEYTLSNVETVKSGSPVVKAWDSGNVTTYTDDTLFPITAIRMVNISGTTQMIGGAR